MLSAISILRHTVKRLNGDDKLTVTSNSDKLVPVRALLLAIKACQGYLKSKDHLDIQEEQLLEVNENVFLIRNNALLHFNSLSSSSSPEYLKIETFQIQFMLELLSPSAPDKISHSFKSILANDSIYFQPFNI